MIKISLTITIVVMEKILEGVCKTLSCGRTNH